MFPKSYIRSAALGLMLSGTCPGVAQTPAFEGSLADYLALDPAGVSIGDAVFSDFKLLPNQSGAAGVGADFTFIVPDSDPANPGFRVEIMDGATPPDFFELRFSFRVSGTFFNRAELSLESANVRSDANGGVDALLLLSQTGSNDPTVGRLISFVAPNGNNDRTSNTSFSPMNDLTVEFDVVIDGGGLGRPGEVTASLGSVSLSLGIAPPPLPLRVKNAGLVDSSTYFIEFQSAPFSTHIITASDSLDDGFTETVTLIGGSAATDAGGLARVEFSIAGYGPSKFFRVESST